MRLHVKETNATRLPAAETEPASAPHRCEFRRSDRRPVEVDFSSEFCAESTKLNENEY